MIAGVSRYAHSLGVTWLAVQIAQHLKMTDDDYKSLVCAALLHDAGIPPLGHLTEESFDLCGHPIDHEGSLRSLILEQGRIFAQMPSGRKIGVSDALSKIDVDASRVFDAVLGRSDLGHYLKSDIDIDNIDNIVRIFRLTGNESGYDPHKLAVRYFVSGDNTAKDEWADVRHRLYSRLMFSIPDFAMKATTKRLICSYLRLRFEEDGNVGAEHSEILQEILFFNDSQFFTLLADESATAADMAYGRTDRLVTHGWIERRSTPVLNSLRTAIHDVGDGYYFDHIPDKRVKDSGGGFGTGALVGAFCISTGSRESDKACESAFRNRQVAPIYHNIDPTQPSIQRGLF